MNTKKNQMHSWLRMIISLGVGLIAAGLAGLLSFWIPDQYATSQGWKVTSMVALIAGIWSAAGFLSLLTLGLFKFQKRPETEAVMISRLYRLASVIAIVLALAYCFGTLGRFGTLFSLFGGMLMGWSLQAPVSGFAAWVLISIKRPFRPGDRIQFPSLGLVGDVKEIGAMYVNLDQVGGSVGSEEATGRRILIPNAMLFSQVLINFTVIQQEPYMLDEVILRITYDSNIEVAEKMLLEAARAVTGDIIKATGSEPYIRADLYDYGTYLRLRYQTRVKDRAEIAYMLNKHILQAMRGAPEVDLAIPYVYSYQTGRDRKEDGIPLGRDGQKVQQVEMSKIQSESRSFDPRDVEQLAHSIAGAGLLQPIILQKQADGKSYSIVAGGLRFEACKSLGWKNIPAIIRSRDSGADHQ